MDDAVDYAIEVRTLRAQPVAGIRAVAKPEAIGATLADLLPEVLAYLDREGQTPAGPPYNRYHGAQEDGIALEAGFPIAIPIVGNGRVEGGELPAGPAAITLHRGSYPGLRDAYRALGLWLKAEGRALHGLPWEFYTIGPDQEDDPERWRTEVVWPIQGGAAR